MSLRTRVAATVGLAVAVVVLGVALAVYVADRSELRGQIDRSLTDSARPLRFLDRVPGPRRPRFEAGPPLRAAAPAPFGGPRGYFQFVRADGTVRRPQDETQPLPVDPKVLAVARGVRGSYLTELTADHTHLRELVVPESHGGAVQIARPLTETDRVLRELLVKLAIIGAAGIALAALAGALVARAALAPISLFTKRTEAIAGNPEPSLRLEARGRDELARLARSFNTTLDALEQSVQAQRHLVADASHELRTPIASLRTNIQVLTDADRLPASEHAALRADIIGELDALTALVSDVVDLARGAEPSATADDVELDQIVAIAARRAARRAPDMRLRTDLTPTVVRGTPEQIDRAVVNLLHNAVKWSPAGSEIEISLSEGVLGVRDHGPGFSDDALPFVFDRFYRADDARRMPGSGLGLAIVRQTAEAHNGWARAANAAGGGALLEVFFGDPIVLGTEADSAAQD